MRVRFTHVDVLDRLLDYDFWITHRVIERCALLSAEERQRRFDIGWETIQAMLVHIVRNMELWSDLLYARAPRHSGDYHEPEPTIEELVVRHDAVSKEIASFARAGAGTGKLEGLMLDVLCDPPIDYTIGTVLCDIFHENIVHRSEIKHMLKRLGEPPKKLPGTDISASPCG